MIEVKVYQTNDGRRFDLRDEAESWEKRQAIYAQIESGIYWREVDPDTILDWMLENKDIVEEFLGD